MNCIHNEMERIQKRCSSDEVRKRSMENFQKILHKNQYDEKMIQEASNKSKKKRQKKRVIKDPVYLKFPYISDSITYKVQRIFAAADLPVRVFDRNYTLRSALSTRKKNRRCTMKNCTIDSPNLCFQRKCVYEVKCVNCGDTYIGSTLRFLHTRIHEHLTRNASSVFQHKEHCKAAFQVSRLATASDVTSLRFKEAIMIKRHAPAMTSKKARKSYP